jgi:cytochrome oxidase Cu insertion factor (SCO1/SenC/PrrC family)
MIENISKNIEYSQYESILIKMSYQKIFFYLRLLKKKQILNETIKYFNKEIEKNTKIEKQLEENLNNFYTILKKTLNEVNNMNIEQFSINSNINETTNDNNNNNNNSNNNNNNLFLMDEDSLI